MIQYGIGVAYFSAAVVVDLFWLRRGKTLFICGFTGRRDALFNAAVLSLKQGVRFAYITMFPSYAGKSSFRRSTGHGDLFGAEIHCHPGIPQIKILKLNKTTNSFNAIVTERESDG